MNGNSHANTYRGDYTAMALINFHKHVD